MQTPGLTNRKRIRGMHIWASRHIHAKPNVNPEDVYIDATGMWEESSSAIPGGSVRLFITRVAARRFDERTEVSEGILASPIRSKGPNLMNRKGTKSLDEICRRRKDGLDAGAARMVTDGIRESKVAARQWSSAAEECSNPEEMMLIEKMIGYGCRTKSVFKI